MQIPRSTPLRELIASGFAFVGGAEMNGELGHILAHPTWSEFVDSWNDLALDTYLAERGSFRRRRHAVFSVAREGGITREPHQPHFQSKSYNTLQGGIERWFEPILPAIADSDVLAHVLRFSTTTFGYLSPQTKSWRVEVHQFRIEAMLGQEGLPTPEGAHRDGVDYVLVSLVRRSNIARGTTMILTADGEELGKFTLTAPLDTALVDDNRVFHGVTPVHSVNEYYPAYRDVLVVTYRAQ
jgi:hypothetical protein